MHNVFDIVTVNTRKLKKILKAQGINPQIVKGICNTYSCRMVIVDDSAAPNYVAIMYIPEHPEWNLKPRNVPHSLTRRIRKADPRWVEKMTVKESTDA